MVESRVLGCIPQREALGVVHAVHVVPPKVPPSATIFRGGVLMGLLDFVQVSATTLFSPLLSLFLSDEK